MGGSRLPNKMLLSLHGHPIVEWVFRRVSLAKKIDRVLFAIPETGENDLLEDFLNSIGAEVFRGDENDLVDRYCRAANFVQAEYVVRICADNPLVSPFALDYLIAFFENSGADYGYNHVPINNNWPDGLGGEICHCSLLNQLNSSAIKHEHREHIFNYIWENKDDFKIVTFKAPEELAYPNLKLDIDTYMDYQSLLNRPYRINMTAEQIISTAINMI